MEKRQFLLYSPLQDKRQSMYETLFQAVLDSCTTLGFQPDPITIHVDLEIGLIQSLRAVFGEDFGIQGCFYHLTQATWWIIKDLGLVQLYKTNQDFKLFCGMLHGLAFLPVRDVLAGMDFLRTVDMPGSKDLLDYFDTT